MDPGRRRHYAAFYGDTGAGDTGAGDTGAGDQPVLLVHGNCQAESLRVLLEPAMPDLHAVRMPPVHELTADDLPHLDHLLARCELLVTQPVRDGYRDLPLGVAQLQVPGRVVRVPIIRINRLHPYQVIIRDPADPSRPPPVVPYHDLRTLVGRAGAPARALVQVGIDGLAELARRERAVDVPISDAVDALGAAAAWTINHPGNELLRELAGRVLELIGRPAAVPDPGRVLLGGVRAPLEREVLAALGLDAPPRPTWLVDGREVDDAEVRAAQSAWYADNPAVVAAGLARHQGALRTLGLS